MEEKQKGSDAILGVVKSMMDRVMEKVLYVDPFVVENHHASKPLYAALVPDEIFKGSHFERRFVTPFGHIWEYLSVAAATVYHGSCLKEHTVSGTIGDVSLRRIQEVLNKLEHPTAGVRTKPDWDKELAYIKAGGGNPVPVSVLCDIYIHSQITGENYAFELKAPLPNSDQTKVSKEKMFKLLAMNEKPVKGAYYALPYNPYGKKREDYKWSFPKRWFDMQRDSCVLIGEDYWNMIGGEGTYEFFIQEINKLGKSYRERIYREYLGIEPPSGFDDDILK